MIGIKKCKLKTTLLRVVSVALLGCMCFGNTMEVKAGGSHKTTRNGTPKSSKQTNTPGAPKKKFKRSSRLGDDSCGVCNNLICLFEAESDMPEKQAKFQTTPLQIRSKENVLAEIENNDRLKWLYYCQLKDNEVMQAYFIEKLRIMPYNVDKTEFVNKFIGEHPKYNGLPKPIWPESLNEDKKISPVPEQVMAPELKRNRFSSEQTELISKKFKDSDEESICVIQ